MLMAQTRQFAIFRDDLSFFLVGIFGFFGRNLEDETSSFILFELGWWTCDKMIPELVRQNLSKMNPENIFRTLEIAIDVIKSQFAMDVKLDFNKIIESQ